MRILAMDTATSAITVAVHDGEAVLAARSTIDARRHTELLAPLILETLAAASTTADEVTHVAVGTGPGPFTGLRVGLVTAQTFAHARGISVHGVCSLDALAAAAAQQGHEGDLLVATDARRKEVYWARYRCAAGQSSALDEPTVTKPADLPDGVRTLPTAGRGAGLYPELLPHALAPGGVDLLDVDAGVLAGVAAAGITAGRKMPIEPLYLRRPDAVAAAPEPKSSLRPSPRQQQRDLRRAAEREARGGEATQ
ncbi:tRNA (adenosine(37)-N6)-threonylcarbamoyltransferase complex dimerization subunit type 1 TsaB [Janibacter sp. Soil728]|uniref:tRNA (adenosine(37)-N6)-threonylcarbamoyltransferase complex dimerization subunit type 1 TsaB n=1 Tax=Janibacter sp. Soil728 TaxID=1736393 RepID=UPI0009EB83DE|nr:tRNA (adenosine(37)-N6)-threonylcarbamoyltransferase complex dimerization subunit type 1 TsaB [Janibacter sp. Soil728]